jgi:hypothetical protein
MTFATLSLNTDNITLFTRKIFEGKEDILARYGVEK